MSEEKKYMNNMGVFYAAAAFLGIMASFQNFIVHFIIFCLYLIFLIKNKKYRLIQVIATILFFVVFFVRSEVEIANNKTHLTGNEQWFELHFNEIGKIEGDRLTIKAFDRVTSETLIVRYRIRSAKEKQILQKKLSPGIVCRVKGKLEEPSSSTNENAFDYKKYLQQNHIYWILKPEQLDMDTCRPKPSFLTILRKIRADGIHYLQAYFPKETVPLAAALLFGTSDLLSSDTMDDYRNLGLVHLLAISGLHIAIIVAIVNFLLLRMGITREKSFVMLIVCLPVYCILTGASPSVNRSVLMTMLLLIGKRWGKNGKLTPLDAISLTFLLYLFVSPLAIFNIGFQLSFLVTFALLISSFYILKRNEHPISLLLVTSFLSMIITAPLLLYFFFEFSIISLLVNLLYIPLFNVILLPYVLFGFLFHLLFGSIVNPLLKPLDLLIIFTNQVTEKISMLPWNTVILGRPSLPLVFLYCWGIFLFFVLWEKGVSGVRKLLLFLLPCTLCIGQWAVTNFSSQGEVTFLDVGQGDSIYIRLPYGKGHYLIDTGGTISFEKKPWQQVNDGYEVGEDTVVPFLKSKGVTTIDKLILTHGDADHVGGAKAVMRELKVREIVLPDIKNRSSLEAELIQLGQQKQTAIRYVHEGESWQVDENRFYILSPKENSTLTSNNASIVLYTVLGKTSWLFTGDLEKEGELVLMQKYPQLSADVLKVGHHGSHSSTTELFLEQIAPKMAVISAGKNNSFGHPHPEVIERLERKKINILRTDITGAITFTFNKESGTFSVHHP
ncbi:DNA internalization-related competence protein ComEC/Rec2 [Niallia endozanthoxylica]|uniref:DNA internalization-related competence protein ComEC/Rec2 n=2 Tax=Niallia endozanthoxylica TaxID=2036016 RepID=A0A5J5HZF0_9BACI|nr:DNA internalization-related competence protein ComEC/Rec2 [Niallia endozanthoxylica]